MGSPANTPPRRGMAAAWRISALRGYRLHDVGQGGDGAEPARVGHRRREGGVPDVVHAPLDDGVLDLEQLGDPGLEHHGVEVAREQPRSVDKVRVPASVAPRSDVTI